MFSTGLSGITRRSVVELASTFPGITVQERRITLAEILSGLAEGRQTEIFLTGTAVTVAPVGGLRYRDNVYAVGALVGTAHFVAYTVYSIVIPIL